MSSDFITQIPHEWYWLFLFVSVFIENIFPPYPGDTVVVFAGYIVGIGHLAFWQAAIAILLGNLISASIMYFFGIEIMEFAAKKVKIKFVQDIFSRESLEKTHGWFEKYGLWAVIFSRFSAGIRFFVAIVAGMAKMNYIIFLIAFSIATVIWNSLLVYGGFALGKNWDTVLSYIRLYSSLIAVVIGLGILFLLYRYNQKKKSEKSP